VIAVESDMVTVRHGETEWSRTGRHTGRTDIPLTPAGREAAMALRPTLAKLGFATTFCSPLLRARDTCQLAGLGDRVEIDQDLAEWDYGEFEGLTQDEIDQRKPGWRIFNDGGPGGESPDDIVIRFDRVIAKLRRAPGPVAVFSHGHLLRALAVRWIDLPLRAGNRFTLDTSTLSMLGYYRDVPAIKRWNVPIEGERSHV
jgi:broad specificity phosphatase PhoE